MRGRAGANPVNIPSGSIESPTASGGARYVNPDRIYREHRDDALASQVTAAEYKTFVAMPFSDRFSYRPKDVFKTVICAAAKQATQRNEAERPFAQPRRVDDRAPVASPITEDIVVDVLESHFFVADLTFANAGVLLETGIALGLKPTSQIILLLQGDPRDLHFDIKDNRVITYGPPKRAGVERIATALIEAARAFEQDRRRYVEFVTEGLSPDAIHCLRIYAYLCKTQPGKRPSLHRGLASKSAQDAMSYRLFPDTVHSAYPVGTDFTLVLLTDALRELVSKRLLRTEYQVGALPEGDAFGGHTTPLGWAVIEHLWPELGRAHEVSNET
jgi:hypothetical protein